ncbi:MAG: hypothetical protein HOV96_40980, partial [Nonomuraea sp.]|nr:hypothetical protein [Nonomuraea sp.]
KLALRAGPAGQLLVWIANEYHRTVEPLVWPGCWGYAERAVRGGTDLSNHASGTAADFNAPAHPLGTAPETTFDPAKLAAARALADRTILRGKRIVRWGGDYGVPLRGGVAGSRPDSMHWEINDGVSEAMCAETLAIVTGAAPEPVKPAMRAVPPRLTWNLPAGHYYGNIHGPATSHGGYYASERPFVQNIQQWLIYHGCVPGVNDFQASGWDDGRWEAPTDAAMSLWHARFYPGQPYPAQCWADDYDRLARP